MTDRSRESLRGLGRAALLAASLAFAAVARAEPVAVTFLQVHAVYEISPKGGRSRLAERATLLERERASAAHSITTFGGDLLSPSVLSGRVQGAQMIELTNLIGVAVAVPGNHEFDFGPEVARARFTASDYPWLAANMVGPPASRPWAQSKAGSLRSAASVSPSSASSIPTPPPCPHPGPTSASRIRSPPPRVVAELREAGADLVVALTRRDLAEDRKLLRRVDGVAIVLGGHDHDPITLSDSGGLIVKAGSDAHSLAAVDSHLDRVEERGKQVVVWTPEWRCLSTAGVETQPEIAAIVARSNAKLEAEPGVPVGRRLVELETRRDSVRTGERNVGNRVADAMRHTTGANIAVTNGGGSRGDRTDPPGTELTRKDIPTELPFGNVTEVVEPSGADPLELLENGVSQVEDKTGRFLQASGLRFTYDPSKPAGTRVVLVEVGGEPLDPTRTYRVATNDFMLAGGDGDAAFARGRVIIDASGGTLMTTTVMDYITALGGEISPAVEGRVTRVE